MGSSQMGSMLAVPALPLKTMMRSTGMHYGLLGISCASGACVLPLSHHACAYEDNGRYETSAIASKQHSGHSIGPNIIISGVYVLLPPTYCSSFVHLQDVQA